MNHGVAERPIQEIYDSRVIARYVSEKQAMLACFFALKIKSKLSTPKGCRTYLLKLSLIIT